MRIDNSFERYRKSGNDRYEYSVSHLFGSVLDVGCGDGYGIVLMNNQSAIKKITGIDIQSEAIQAAMTNLHGIDAIVLTAEAENIPFPCNSFDSVHCGQTLEHVKDDEKVLKEIQRVVRKRAVISVPINGGLSEQHVRQYKSEREFKDKVSKYFKVVDSKIFIDEKKHKRVVLIAEK
jgi:ubiquinone/menaquinone biosynthesis C-methylase UbiE